jgi:hypothetical protein
LDLVELSGRIKNSLGKLKDDRPQIKAMFMGTRNTDPYSGQEIFSFNINWECCYTKKYWIDSVKGSH